MKQEIKVIVKNPGRRAEPRVIPNTLQELQGIVGGKIEVFCLFADACIICNEEGKLQGLPFNFSLRFEQFVGPVIFAGIDGEDFDDWPGGMDTITTLFGTILEVQS